MVVFAYDLLAAVVMFGGLGMLLLALHDPRRDGAMGGLPDLRTPARCCYVVIGVLSVMIGLGDLPRSRRDTDLLWIVPLSIAVEGFLWPFALSRRLAPEDWGLD